MEKFPQRKSFGIKIVFGVLATLLVLLLALFVRQVAIMRPSLISLSPRSWHLSVRSRRPLTASDAASIQSWMTFDYLNKVFALPPEFLKTTFGITDPRYPRLSLAHYAETKGVSAANFTDAVKNAIRNELSGTS